VTNSILWGNVLEAISTPSGLPPTVTYSDIQGGTIGTGNLDIEPAFADPGHWDDANTPHAWVPGDYHLQSTRGRFSPALQTWVTDAAHSPCIDAGAPASGAAQEPQPNGGRPNLGAFGATPQASKSR
jgi:hypothetical protein